MNLSKVIMATVFVLFSLHTVKAQEAIPSIVRVTGEGIVKAVPDGASVKVRVENEGNNAKEVKGANDKAVAAVIAYCKKVKIKDKDVQTEYVNLNKNYDYNRKTYKYIANQTICISIRDLQNFDVIMSGLIDSGINRINGVQFTSSRLSELQVEARKKAVAAAKQKAVDYTAVLGQQVGKAVQIQEQQAASVPVAYESRMMMKAATGMSDPDGPTIAPGELIISSKIDITFELK